MNRRRRRRRAGKATYLAFPVSICSTICVAIDAGLLRIKIVSSTASSRGRRRRVSVLGAPLVSHVYHKVNASKRELQVRFWVSKVARTTTCSSLLPLSLTHTRFLRAILVAQQHQQQKNSTNKTLQRHHHHHAQNTIILRTNPVINPGYKLRLQMKLPLTLV